MAETTPSVPSNPASEAVLLRLFRCMTASEQEEFFAEALDVLGKRNSLNSHYQLLKPEAIQAEFEEELNDRLFAAWPGGWPGQQIVELDNVGDPDDWLQTSLTESIASCLFSPGSEEHFAEFLADDYLQVIREANYPLPSDFDDSPTDGGWTEDDKKQVKADFVRFLNHWRECILETLEKQTRSKPEGNK